MPPSLNDRIAALKAKQEQLAVRLNTLSVKARQEERKRDTRRKIVVGSTVLMAMEKDAALAAGVMALLDRYVEREHDREVIADLLPRRIGADGAPALPAAGDGERDKGGAGAAGMVPGVTSGDVAKLGK